MKRLLCGLGILGLLFGAIGQARSQYIYYSEGGYGTISRVNLHDRGQTTLLTGLAGPIGPTLDLAAGKMYWTEVRMGVIQRANLDGSGMETLVSDLPTGIASVWAPSLDLVRGQMYWTVNPPTGSGYIQRANLDATEPTILINERNGPPLNFPIGVALHLACSKIYWADAVDGDIRRANLDGSGEEILLSGLPRPQVVALDVAAGKMYWGDRFAGEILRANLDGSGKETVVGGLPQGAGPTGIALDVAGGKVYWSDNDITGPNGDIRRANLDGSGQETLVTGLYVPAWISLDLGGPGAAVSLVVAASASVPPGTPFDITVTALDPFGNIDVNYQGTVTFSTSDSDPGIVLPADYTFTAADAGVHTFPGGVTLITPGDQTVTTTDTASSITGKATVTVVPPG